MTPKLQKIKYQTGMEHLRGPTVTHLETHEAGFDAAVKVFEPLVEALEYYARGQHIEIHPSSDPSEIIETECGDRAIEALKKIK